MPSIWSNMLLYTVITWCNVNVCLFDIHTSAKCKLVRKQCANLPDTPGDLTSASKYFYKLPGLPGAKQSALRLCKSIHRMLWDLTERIVKFWSSWDLCPNLRETLRDAETATQYCGRLGAVFSQQWFLHYHKAFRLCYSHKISYIIIWHALFKSFYIYTYGRSARTW